MSKNSKKILMILNNHFTHDARVLKEATSLISRGHSVNVRCYMDKGLKKNEVKNGVNIERVKFISRDYRKNLPSKLYLLTCFTIQVIRDSRQFDVIHCHDLMNLPIAVFAKWYNGNKQSIVYDSHEYQIEQSGKPKWMRPILKIIEQFFIKKVDHVITVSDSIANEYARIYNIPKPNILLNCSKHTAIKKQNKFREKFDISDEQIIFLYQGGFTKNRGIENIIECFKNLKQNNKVVVFMGYGMLENKIQEAANNSDKIFFHPAVSQKELLNYTSSADVGIITYQNTCLNHYYCCPNKFFEYTMAGLPIVASNLFELSKIIKQYNNGYICEDDSAASLLKTVENIDKDDLVQKLHNIPQMQKEFCWENQEKVLYNIYDKIFAA
jgi:glycosyltransferase involved in cell wall biosynthesis